MQHRGRSELLHFSSLAQEGLCAEVMQSILASRFCWIELGACGAKQSFDTGAGVGSTEWNEGHEAVRLSPRTLY